jgi:uncharacterized protein (TIGR02246 family)
MFSMFSTVMKFILLLFVSIFFSSASAATANNQADGDYMQITQLVKEYQQALNDGNGAIVRELYTADGSFVGQGFPTAQGSDEIVAMYTDFLSKLDFNIQFDIKELKLGEEYGFLRTASHGTIVPKGVTPSKQEGNREVFLLKKVAGHWKFYYYIFNAEVK